jgi:hypothetical protein
VFDFKFVVVLLDDPPAIVNGTNDPGARLIGCFEPFLAAAEKPLVAANCAQPRCFLPTFHRTRHRFGKAKQDAHQELVVGALEPLEGRCSQRPDARQKIILVGISETAGIASNCIY